MTLLFGIPTAQKIIETLGPIVIREVSKPRFRRFIEEKVGDVATELARQRFTKKSKRSFIMTKGSQKFTCRRMSR